MRNSLKYSALKWKTGGPEVQKYLMRASRGPGMMLLPLHGQEKTQSGELSLGLGASQVSGLERDRKKGLSSALLPMSRCYRV